MKVLVTFVDEEIEPSPNSITLAALHAAEQGDYEAAEIRRTLRHSRFIGGCWFARQQRTTTRKAEIS